MPRCGLYSARGAPASDSGPWMVIVFDAERSCHPCCIPLRADRLLIISNCTPSLYINFTNKSQLQNRKHMQASFGPSPSGNSSFSHAQVLKQSYNTPMKKQSQQTAQKTLKKSILEKLEASKQSSANRQIRRSLNSQVLKQDKHQQKQRQEQSQSAQKELILSNQSQNNPGFYEYTHWLKLHAQSLSFVGKKYVQELWKILRLINYGEVYIPTGLVYQIFMDIKKNSNLGGFQRIINNFLSQNETFDSLKSFKDLKNYMDLRKIEKVYKCINDEQKNQAPNRRVRSQSTSDAFERNFAEAKVRTEKKISKICSALVEQSKKLTQKPKISVYKSQSYKSLVKPERICHHTEQHKHKNQQEKYLEQNNGVLQNLFKAKQLDKSIFEGNIDNIPGVVSHLSRNQYCQAQKLKAQREAMRPQYSKKKIY